MTEKAKKIHIELKTWESGITSFAGLWPAVELFRKSGLPEVIDSAVGARSSRGFRDSEQSFPSSFSISPEEAQRTTSPS